MKKESDANHRRPIFPDLVVHTPTYRVSPFDLKRASILKAALQKHLKAIRPISIKVWAKDFSKLRLVDKLTKKEIRETLDWYVSHFNEDYVPQAYSASGFRKKYFAIRRAMLRTVNIPTKVSEEAVLIVDSLLALTWPKGTKNELPITVQMSLKAYSDFIESRSKAGDSIARGEHKVRGGSLRQFVGFHAHMEYVLTSPKSFVLQWMRQLNDRLESWEEWSGNLRSMAFNVKSKQFQRMGRIWAQDYCQDPARWDFYLENIHADNSSS